MKSKYKSMIRTLLLEGGSEDLNRDLDLVSFHLERVTDWQSEVKCLIEGLKRGIPVSRVIGYSLICGIPISINEDVLDPGPETVTLAEKAIKYIKSKHALSALDL